MTLARRPLILGGVLLSLLGVPGGVSAAGRSLPCIPLDALDGRCEAWSATHDGAVGFDAVRAVTTSPDGTAVYVAGEVRTDDGVRALTIAYDAADGEQRWIAADGRGGDEYDFAGAVAISPDGSVVYTAGGACSATLDGSSCDVLVVARDTLTGAKRWIEIRDGAGHGLDTAQDVVLDPVGSTLFVGGQTFSPATDEDYLVAALDADTGAERWTATYDGPAQGFDRGADLVLAGDAVVLTGASAGAGDNPADAATVAFDTRDAHEGERLWAARFDGSGGRDEAFAIDADRDGERVVIAGLSQGSTPATDPIVVAYDAATGEQAWTDRYAGGGVAGGILFDVAITRDGRRAVATGYTQRSDGKGPSTLGYNADTGQRLWAVNLDGGLGYAATTSPDGRRAYVTGTTYTQRGTMHRTVSYLLETGEPRWSGLYEETAPPTSVVSTVIYPSAIAMSPDGTHVYVGGVTRPLLGTQDDALTLAYQA